jgi:hypothetical protein
MLFMGVFDWNHAEGDTYMRDMTTSHPRLTPGHVLTPFSVETLSHGRVAVPHDGDGLLHLQFRRFAGCPICSLHLRSFARAKERLAAEGIATMAFFHSSRSSLAPYHADLPFFVVPDPERAHYRTFGVESSMAGLLHPRAMLAGMLGLARAPSNPFVGEGGHAGLPADFLVSRGGAVLAVKYGKHADDQWDVDEVIRRAHLASLRHQPV